MTDNQFLWISRKILRIGKLLRRIHRTNQIVLAMFFKNLSLYLYHRVREADWDDLIIEVLTDWFEKDDFIHKKFESPRMNYTGVKR